jgi:hypothetical protein
MLACEPADTSGDLAIVYDTRTDVRTTNDLCKWHESAIQRIKSQGVTAIMPWYVTWASCIICLLSMQKEEIPSNDFT